MKTFFFLKRGENLREVASLRVTLGTEHAHQALRRFLGESGQRFESDVGVDVVRCLGSDITITTIFKSRNSINCHSAV